MRTITAYPIKSSEGVTVRLAQYENEFRDFVEAGGRQISEEEMKSDLAALLPAELGDYMAVRVTDPRQFYKAFRDFAVFTCSQLFYRKNMALGPPR